MISRWQPASPKRRTARTRRVAAVTVTALAAVLVQAALAAHANTAPSPAPPSGARPAAEPARHDLTRDTEADPKAAPKAAHKAEAVWLDANTVVWNGAKSAASTQLLYAHDGDLSDARRLRLRGSELTQAQKEKFPHLAKHTAWSVDPRDRDRAHDRVREALRGRVVATQLAANGAVVAETAVQIAGVLDDLYDARDADLGPVLRKGRPTLSLWAPTAQNVSLEIGEKAAAVPMKRDGNTGVWSVTGPKSWKNKPYRYVVKVWAPTVQKVVTNKVTDPYSLALTTDSKRSLVIDLADKSLAPHGWSRLRKPKAVPLKDAQIQELHIRDFSIEDRTAKHPGTYLAFTDKNSDGSRHLKKLAEAGTSYVHLLPAFDIATIPETKADQAAPGCDLVSYPADSDQQQECVAKTAAKDAYNWGYDPYHFTVPEGSYATDPEGTDRTVEFRKMVKSLNDDGLRVVMDVVYNHTTSSGQAGTSVLDKIVPGYYQRLLADGSVATSTCCANTAPENAMMGKLVVDSIITWAKQYKVDGFRFDLMGHHPKANILAVRKALDALTLEKDGVDGKAIILYGEGWNFGEVADDARFVQATQKNMAGTGIATFSDRARDAVRGGGPFDEDPGVQGFASGLFTDPNSSANNGTSEEQKARLLHYQDLIKVGLSGNLADYRFTDSSGRAGQGLRGRLQRGARRIRGRARRCSRLCGRARQRVAVRRARLQAAVLDECGRPCSYAGPRHGHRHALAGTGALPGGHRPAAFQVPGPQLVRQRRLVQRDPLGLPGRQRLRARAADGRRQSVQVAIRQAPVGLHRGGLPADRGHLGRVPGPAEDPYERERLRALHRRAGAVPAVLPAVRRQRGDARCDHDEPRRPGRRLQRDARAADTGDRGARGEAVRAASGAGRGLGPGRQGLVVRDGVGHLRCPGPQCRGLLAGHRLGCWQEP